VWVPIPGGTFDMGSTYDHNERPVHSVSVSSFEMLQTEVTVAQYGLCVTDGACSEPSGGGDCNWNDQITYRDHPVNCIEWQQAVDFCAWAGGRLPSEAEWEHAARSGGQPITYPWGDGEASCDYAVMKDPTLGEGCGTNHTWTVCSKEDGNTAQGLCDMGGNTWEWTQDSYHADYEGAPDNGSAWDDGGDTRVRRGGSFRNPASGLRTANRDSDIAIERVGVAIGLRCTR
jgi:formylglycine-generating enzyme required for sulfatase activity